MATNFESTGPGGPATAPHADRARRRAPYGWQGLSALFLLVMGGIHLYLVLTAVGGVLGGLFVVTAVGALVLAVAVVVLRRQALVVACVLSVLFIAGTLLSLVLALTVGLFGITETLDFQLVPTTLVVEAIGTIVLLVTTVLVFRSQRR